MMDVRHTSEATGGAFFAENDEGVRLAELTYSSAGDKSIIIDHTQVDESQRGVGLARRLVEAAVEFARKERLSIIPLCPVANGILRRTPEWHDVLDDAKRGNRAS